MRITKDFFGAWGQQGTAPVRLGQAIPLSRAPLLAKVNPRPQSAPSFPPVPQPPSPNHVQDCPVCRSFGGGSFPGRR
jgi:hypothetical protein